MYTQTTRKSRKRAHEDEAQEDAEDIDSISGCGRRFDGIGLLTCVCAHWHWSPISRPGQHNPTLHVLLARSENSLHYACLCIRPCVLDQHFQNTSIARDLSAEMYWNGVVNEIHWQPFTCDLLHPLACIRTTLIITMLEQVSLRGPAVAPLSRPATVSARR